MRSSSIAAAAIAAILSSSSALAAPFDLVEKSLAIALAVRPQVTTAESYPANKVAWPCPLNTRGSAPNPATPGFVRVGWSHGFDAGTPPFACQYRINHVERAIIAPPDLKPLRDRLPRMFVKSARLSFDKKRIAGDHDCADKVLAVVPGEASIPPNVEALFDLPVPALASGGCVGGRCTIEMRGLVDQWVRGSAAELGLAVIGDQERLDANDNVSCVTDYANFKLDVDYKYDVERGTLVVPILKGPIKLSPLINLGVSFVRKTTDTVIYDLKWNVISTTGSMDVVRDGAVVLTVPDRGNQRDRAPLGPHRYKVCVAGTSNCSNEVSVSD